MRFAYCTLGGEVLHGSFLCAYSLNNNLNMQIAGILLRVTSFLSDCFDTVSHNHFSATRNVNNEGGQLAKILIITSWLFYLLMVL